MGALDTDNVRRGEFVSKRAVFEGIVADPALDGGVVACGVVCDGGGDGAIRNPGASPAGGGGGGIRRSGVAPGGCDGGGRGKSRQGTGLGGVTTVQLENGTISGHDRSGGGLVVPSAAGIVINNGNNDTDDNNTNTNTNNTNTNNNNNNNNNDTTNKAIKKRGKAASLAAAASTCATAGGSLVPAEFRPRVSTAGAAQAMTAEAAASGDEDHRKSSIFVWPRKLEATSEEAGLEAEVPYRLTCVRSTAFEARFKGAHNALLAGTKEGLALAFDWGCLLRNSGGGGGGGGGGGSGACSGREGGNGWKKGDALAPSAQVWRDSGGFIFGVVVSSTEGNKLRFPSFQVVRPGELETLPTTRSYLEQSQRREVSLRYVIPVRDSKAKRPKASKAQDALSRRIRVVARLFRQYRQSRVDESRGPPCTSLAMFVGLRRPSRKQICQNPERYTHAWLRIPPRDIAVYRTMRCLGVFRSMIWATTLNIFHKPF